MGFGKYEGYYSDLKIVIIDINPYYKYLYILKTGIIFRLHKLEFWIR